MANTGFLRLAGLLCVIGGILQLVLGIAESFFPVQALSPEFVFRQVLVEISYVPVLIGVIGLALSGVAGNGWLAKIGLGGALLGSFLFILAGMIMLLVQPALGEALYGIGTLLTGSGMLLAGLAVLKTRGWSEWRRYTPLICGLYVFVVLFPAAAIVQGPSFLALGGWGVCWLLFGVALRSEACAQQTAQQAASPAISTVAPR